MPLKQKLGLAEQPVFLMDGTAFIYRAFFANRHLMRSDGFPTNALVIVTRVLLRILREEQATHLLFVMDGRGGTFRNELYAPYKANREAMPEELAQQIEPIRRMVAALGPRIEVASGIEADDCIASLAARLKNERPVVIVSGDKDLKQCLGPNVFIWDPASREEKILTAAGFEAETGVAPGRWPDMQALIGDSSDNIPGVPGIGPKTARQIFASFSSLEDIRDHLSELPPRIQAKLSPHIDDMFLFRRLTTLRSDALPGLKLADLAVGAPDIAECRKLADEFELFALRREIAALMQARQKAAAPAAMNQLGLFTRPEDDAHRANAGAADAGKGQSQPPEKPDPCSAQEIAGAPETADAAEIHLSDKIPAPDVETADVSGLPDSSGRVCALLWPDGAGQPPRIALAPAEGRDMEAGAAPAEYRFTGDISAPAGLSDWLARAEKVVLADIKSVLTGLPALRLPLSRCFDLGLAAYLLNPEDGDYSFLRVSGQFAADFQAREKKPANPAPLAIFMYRAMQSRLAANGLLDLYEKMELPLIPVLARMQAAGIAIDPAAFQVFLEEVSREQSRLVRSIHAEAGTSFNINSSAQLGEVLFQRLKLPAGRKTPGGRPSTSQAALEKLAPDFPLVESVLAYRKLEKMRSTYLDPLPKLMDGQRRIHTTFNQEATATGRLSSSGPNLQNIPIRGDMGRRMRACFIAGEGNMLVAADYSQIELRLLADQSGDQTLLQAFRDNADIHARTASLIFDEAPDRVTPDQRRQAKTINFGLLYGMGANKLAGELHIPVVRAKAFIDRYFEKLSGIRAFYDSVTEKAKKLGYVTTLAGRRRWVPGILSANGQTAAQARRQAINAVIQGSAADIFKLAMLGAANDDELQRLGARMVLQIHDEILLEAPAENAAAAGGRVAAIMQSVKPGGRVLAVPLLVDWGQGRNWAEAH